jgi:hypothetical protein
MAGLDLDACLEKVKKCEHLAEEELKAVCEYVGAELCPVALCSSATVGMQLNELLGDLRKSNRFTCCR